LLGQVIPHLSAFTLAAARLGWPIADCACLTVHGRSIDLLAPHLAPRQRLLVLSENADTPAQVARWLVSRGWGPSRLSVLARMGGSNEAIASGSAESWSAPRGDDLNTLAIDCVAGPEARAFTTAPGLPDDAFIHDGQLTKREIRAATLSALAPLPGELLWDVGAGCGSIAIEWMRAAPRARAVAIERDPARVDFIARNAASLGTPRLKIVAEAAPASLAGLERPDAIFIGGGISDEALLTACWNALAPRGRLVANVVTIEGEAMLAAWHARHGGVMSRIAVSRLERVGPYHGWRALMPITQWSVVK